MKPCAKCGGTNRFRRKDRLGACKQCSSEYLKRYTIKISSQKLACTVPGCDYKIRRNLRNGLCDLHYSRFIKTGATGSPTRLLPLPGDSEWRVHDDGYVKRSIPGRDGWSLQHRVVMEEFLVGEENVHHKNGVRSDNRIENLELWLSSQPSGQRVEDLVAWAKDLLTRYEPGALTVSPSHATIP